MAIIPETNYAGKITPASADYPYGEARNITLPGDGTGTPWEAALVNDIFGFQQAVLSEADITPSGDPETALESQYLSGLKELFFTRVASVAEGFAGVTGIDGRTYEAKGWQDGTVYGGARYIFDASAAKSLHDGGKYISPTVPAVSAQAGGDFQTRRDAFLAATGETDGGGTGVFVAIDELNESNYGAVGGGVVDDSKPLEGYFNSTETIRTLPKAYLVAQAVTKIADNIDCQFGGTKFINGGPGWVFTFGEGSDTPIYEGLTVRGGKFEQQDAGTSENRNFIRVRGTEEVDIKTKCKNVSNGGIYIEAGCERGTVDAKITGKTNYSPARGVWLNGGTASDYAGQLVDTTSVTRNATPFPQFAVKDFSVTGKIKIPGYGVYAINTRDCSVIGADIDISGAGATRCIAVNNYSPGFRAVGNTLRSDRSSTGILVTQASDGVVIAANVFKGTFGGNRDIYVQYLAEAMISNNEFLTDTSQQIQIDMGGAADILGNYSNSPGGYLPSGRFVRISTLDPAIAGTGTVGDTATVLPGSVIKGNTIKQARIGCLAEGLASAAGTIAGIESIVFKNNTLKNWDLSALGGSDWPLFVNSAGTTNKIAYSYYDNDMFPADSANRNRPSTNGDGFDEVRSDALFAVVRVTVTGGSASSNKRYGANLSCASSLSGNDLILSPRSIGGAGGAAVAEVFAIVDVGGTVASYRLTRSGSNYVAELLDAAGAQIALSTTDATVDVVVSTEAS